MRGVPIRVSPNTFTIVDAEDAPLVNKYYWSLHQQRGYVQGRRHGPNHGTHRWVLLHRLILGLRFGERKYADHINHNILDNRRANLRFATPQQNGMNRRTKHGGASPFKGVTRGGWGWRARVRLDGKLRNFGEYKTEEEAAMRYNVEAKKLFGEFAYLNPVEMG